MSQYMGKCLFDRALGASKLESAVSSRIFTLRSELLNATGGMSTGET